MSYLLQKADGRKISLLEVKSPRLRIGRGTNAHLRSENAAVALEHAVIEKRSGAGYEISDRGSITGTYLNGSPIENRVLASGDQIEIGDLVLTVQVADLDRPLFLRVEQARSTAEASRASEPDQPVFQVGTQMRAPKVDFSRSYGLRQGFLTKRSMTIGLLVLAAVGVTAFTITGGNIVYQPGSLSIAHETATKPNGDRVIGAHDCNLCHEPFGGASNAKCSDCHRQLVHQVGLAEVGPCIDCHAEHRQIPRLAEVQERECIECHRRLDGTDVTVARTITSFGKDHPELTIMLADDRRMAVNSVEAKTADTNALKFSHDCHLSGDCNLKPPTADDPRRVKVEFTCESCHEFSEDTGAALPVSFDKTCKGCHPLTFDNRFAPVPHGLTLEAVAGVIANAYAGNEELLTKRPDEIARIFASRGAPRTGSGALIVRNAQRVMDVRCNQCHLTRSGSREILPVAGQRSWFRGMKPFDHRTHMESSLELSCVDCHEGVARSKVAADLSLPGVEACASCHRASEEFQAGLGTCIMCHFYHQTTEPSSDPSRVARASLAGAVATDPGDGTGEDDGEGRARVFPIAAIWTMLAITGVIIAGIVILVAAAAFIAARRDRREMGDALSEIGADTGTLKKAPQPLPKDQAPAPAPTPPPPAQPSAPVQPESSTQVPAPPPPPAEATVVVPLPPRPEATQVVGGTMMIEWHGSLVGISGPLEGKRLPVSSGEGFYMGRDKEVADVVVDDKRVSRRHVWIGVEDGQVVVADQGSTNGTFVNGERIEKTVLAEGDILTLSDQVVSLRYES